MRDAIPQRHAQREVASRQPELHAQAFSIDAIEPIELYGLLEENVQCAPGGVVLKATQISGCSQRPLVSSVRSSTDSSEALQEIHLSLHMFTVLCEMRDQLTRSVVSIS
eukprot:TRINITY_DN2772_c0_g3_i1.p3 TRINITY_DN2772_c0_g3~~TRINITY_DN2772_c0_g3_i1.p3  ORF type:complete len:109 (+),score=16.30 TRINITY_DN2772_c0_g3_i1:428-754(+)